MRTLLVILLLVASPAQACRLALVLGLDISSSVNAQEDALQRQGLAYALRQEDVQAAMLSTPGEPVALAIFEWSGRWQQDMILDWVLLNSAADINAAADTVANSKRSYADFPTAVGEALAYADGLLARAPACLFQTLDLSGDGIQNEGREPAEVYASGALATATVNGLAILGAQDSLVYDAWLMEYYREHVLHGPLAFLEVAETFQDFPAVMTRKLIRETATQVFGRMQ